MRWPLLIIVGVALIGCGDDDPARARGDRSEPTATRTQSALQTAGTATTAQTASRRASPPAGKTIRLGSSPIGRMLFDVRRQAIYIFENDRRNRSVCYGACAEAWPPVLTKGAPRAGQGVRASLLGRTRRRDGRMQVTYAGKPLYYYAHEEPGEVRCHNVDLNGGLWWVVGANGRRRP